MRSLRQQDCKDAPWYLVQCRPNQNHIALRHLTRQRFDVFMPRQKAHYRWRGREIAQMRPIFGGYLFLGTDPVAPRWHEISRTPGVSRLIGFGPHGPTSIPSEIVTGLMLRCDTEGCLLPDADYTAGEKVRITSGPFADFVTTIDAVEPDRRIHVLIEIMGRQARLALHPDSVTRNG